MKELASKNTFLVTVAPKLVDLKKETSFILAQ
jgi:hypothetical protein